MPLISLHAAVELTRDTEAEQRKRDIDRLWNIFPPDGDGSPQPKSAASPFYSLRVAWEMNAGRIESIHVKIMGGILEDPAGWLKDLLAELPSMGREIVGALSHGIIHLTFDDNAEGWTFVPATLSAHERITQRREAAKTLTGRYAPNMASELTESDDPGAIPALLAQRPLPQTGH